MTRPSLKKLRLWLEFFLLCVLLPCIVIGYKLAAYMFLFLWGATLVCAALYRYTPETRGIPLWRVDRVTWRNLKPMLIRFAISSMLMFAFLHYYAPERQFELLTRQPDMWWKVMLLYPLLSALPQEFIFCSFFFARFALIFRKEKHLIAASTVVFAFAHVLFINPVAPLLSLIAGYFFASTYAQHRSLALVFIEHALYGNMLFTLGLGWYFWHGSVH